jgi:hypothetical protein
VVIKKLLGVNNKALSEEETKKFITPFAFRLDKSLFGLPLASPSKRGFALLIDLCLIALISDLSGGLLALAVAFTLLYLSYQHKVDKQGKVRGGKRRKVLRYIAVFMFVIMAIFSWSTLFNEESTGTNEPIVKVNNKGLSLKETLVSGVATYAVIDAVASSECEILSCWRKALNEAAANVAEISYESGIEFTAEQRDEMLNDMLENTDFAPSEKQQLMTSMEQAYVEKYQALVNTEQVEKTIPQAMVQDETVSSFVSTDKDTAVNPSKDKQPVNLNDLDEVDESKYSIIALVEGIINDLGLGFGWATFYFTVFIALSNGQTPGKKLFGIKVLQLDGTPLSLWDSFGRYGGYGAGIATGLLGFMQIYWNANRQAIHDQISATVVIDLRKKRLNSKEHAEQLLQDDLITQQHETDCVPCDDKDTS